MRVSTREHTACGGSQVLTKPTVILLASPETLMSSVTMACRVEMMELTFPTALVRALMSPTAPCSGCRAPCMRVEAVSVKLLVVKAEILQA